jgi:hypothetical protein
MERMAIRGRTRPGDKPGLFGYILRDDKGVVTLDPPDKAELLEVRTMAMGCACGPPLAPDDPYWFDALPIGYNGTARWAEPDDFTAWATRAKELFDFDYLGSPEGGTPPKAK